MNKITGNELAFPLNEEGSISTGLTIRQYYAGLALQGLMVQAIPDRSDADTEEYNSYRAAFAVHMADTIINELNKSK